jgi:hypothetical protein
MSPRRAFLALAAALVVAAPSRADELVAASIVPAVSPVGFEVGLVDQTSRGRMAVTDDVPAMRLATEQSGGRFIDDPRADAIYQPTALKNFAMSLRIKAESGRLEQTGGVAVRMASQDEYYVLQLDAVRDRVVFGLVDHRRSTEIASVDSDIATDAWHTLEVRAEDERFTVSLDGHWLFTAYDTTLGQPGRIALWSKADSVRFDQVSIIALPAAAAP